MLKKLMKYEFKATSRLLIPLYLILLVMSIINRFVFTANNTGEVSILNQFLIFTYIVSIFVVIVVTALYMIVRFYKNLLTDEGYLMFTLPAKSHQHIISKLLVSVLWILISIAIVLVSLFIVFSNHNSFVDIMNGIKEGLNLLNRQFGGSWILMFIELTVMFLLSLIANILLIYVSIAVGQLFTKHKIIGSFAAYMIIYTLLQFLTVIVLIPFGIFMSKTQPDISTLYHVIFPIVIVVLTLGCTAFFLGTDYIFRRKLNLD